MGVLLNNAEEAGRQSGLLTFDHHPQGNFPNTFSADMTIIVATIIKEAEHKHLEDSGFRFRVLCFKFSSS